MTRTLRKTQLPRVFFFDNVIILYTYTRYVIIRLRSNDFRRFKVSFKSRIIFSTVSHTQNVLQNTWKNRLRRIIITWIQIKKRKNLIYEN